MFVKYKYYHMCTWYLFMSGVLIKPYNIFGKGTPVRKCAYTFPVGYIHLP